MASFVIEGGHKLHGEIHPQGAKNEVLQILCATLLTLSFFQWRTSQTNSCHDISPSNPRSLHSSYRSRWTR